MPLIIPANSITGGYTVDNSLRFNSGSSDTLDRNPSGAGNRKTFTISLWVKRAKLGSRQSIFNNTDSGGQDGVYFDFYSDDTLAILDYGTGSYLTPRFETTQVFRDVSAWYHIVYAVDTTQGTESNRVKIYVNGNQVTNFDIANYPSQNQDTLWNRADRIYIGTYTAGGNYLGAYLSEVVNIDGLQLDPTSFGEFDEDSGIWKPIDVSGLTFGTNGFYLDFEDSAALGDDVSGNGNDFTVNNLTAVDQTTDTPTNNFCTLNPLSIASNGQGTATLSNGNLTMTSAGSTQNSGTFAPSIDSNSKWYYEFKCGTGATDIDSGVGWGTDVSAFRSGTFATLNSLFLYTADGRLYGTSGWTSPGTAATYTNGDIIGCTVDLENNEIKWYKNNSLAYTISSISFVGDVITPYSQWAQSGAIGDFNFGNPTFTGTDQSDENSRGSFEYAPPSGFLSLCTKNLSEVLG